MKQSLFLSLGFSMLFQVFTLDAGSQNYKFRQYGVQDGLCHPFVYALNQDAKGYIWACTGEGLCRYDGSGFYGDFTADSLPSAFARKSYRDHPTAIASDHFALGQIERYFRCGVIHCHHGRGR